MTDCIFCKIVKGEIPCSKVYEDDEVLAFDDIHPMAPVHVILIPKEHIATLMDIDANHTDVMGRLIAAAQKVPEIKKSGRQRIPHGYELQSEGGQVVFHLHMHLLGGRKLQDQLG